MTIRKIFLGATISLAGAVLTSITAQAASITFPVLGESSFSNDYNSPRGDDLHHATDIIANKNQPVVSATNGTIYYVEYPQRGSQGYMVVVRSTAGNYYYYIHLNNDDKGTDNGDGGGMKAYAPDIEAGNPIKRGQLLGWVGDSGNAENTVSHLHFEIKDDSPNGPNMNPYPRLKNDSSRISKPIDYPALPNEILPFGESYKRKVNVARADVTGDGKEDLITGAEGEGSSPLVRIYNLDTKKRLAGFYVLNRKLKHGVDVAAGDIDGDGKNELITSLRGSKSAKVAIYSYNLTTKQFDKRKEFVVYGGSSSGKTAPRVTVGDIDGDGTDEIITGTGSGTRGLLRVFDAAGDTILSYRPLGAFTGGIDVAAGNIANLPNTDEIVLAPLTIGSSRTKVYSFDLVNKKPTKIEEFYSYGSSYRGGIRLSIGDVSWRHPGFEIVTSPNNGARSVFRAKSLTGETLQADTVLEDWWLGYYDIAASRDGTYQYSFATGGNRRGSVR